MFVILGGTGHVGAATAEALLERGAPVTIVTRSEAKGPAWRQCGADVAVADVHDVDRMRSVLRRGTRAFLLNPPADFSTDTDAVERESVRCILAALEGSGIEKVVAESTYGARPGERCGDLTVLHAFEEGLKAQPIPATIQRAAYYMSNWDGTLDAVRETGTLPSMQPADLPMPMVAPADLGRTAARWLLEPVETTGLRLVEGPERYTPGDAAAAFARALRRPVQVDAIPRSEWEASFRNLGFSDAAAKSYACMTATTVDEAFDPPEKAVRGSVTLDAYVAGLVRGQAAEASRRSAFS